VYYFNHYQEIDVYSAPDGATWAPVHTSIAGPDPKGPGNLAFWGCDVMTGTLPAGTHYVGFRIAANTVQETNKPWAPEIGEIQFSTNKFENFEGELTPSENGPAGLTVMAANGAAFVNWYPLKGAASYTIKRSAGDGGFSSVATNLTATTYNDSGLSGGTTYNYAVLANMPDGTHLCSQILTVTPDAGTVEFNDPLTDWGNVSDHSEGLDFATQIGNITTVRRTAEDTESLTYNLPGCVRFAANVYFQGDLNGQLSARASRDGATWTPVKIANSAPVDLGSNWLVSEISVDGQLPDDTNFLRLSLEGDGSTNSPQVGAIRMTYGATKLTHMMSRTATLK
jgi:hypothetical protein